MSEAQEDQTAHDLRLLKSLLGSQSESSTAGDLDPVKNRPSSAKGKQGRSRRRMNRRTNARKISEEKDGDTHKVVLSLGKIKPIEQDASDTESQRSPKESLPKLHKKRPKPYVPLNCSMDLNTKYQELYLLMSDEYSHRQESVKQKFIRETRQFLINKYGLGSHAQQPVPCMPEKTHVAVGGPDVQVVNGDNFGNEIILIDATEGKHGSTKHVTFDPVRERPAPRVNGTSQSRGRRRPYSAPMRRQMTSQEKASQEEVKRESRKRSPSYSSDYESDSDSNQKSRSTSREKASDHLLKNSTIPAIQEWLKNKEKMLRKQRKEKRQEKRAKSKQEQEEIKEKEQRQELSKQKVHDWMVQKNKEMRLLRKRERQAKRAELRAEEELAATKEETVVLPEKDSSLKVEEGAKCTQCGFDEKQPKPRAQSARLIRRNRPTSSKKKQEVAEVKEEKKITYDEWLKRVRSAQDAKRKEDREKQAKLRESVDDDDAKLISKVARERVESIRGGKKKIETGLEQVDDEANAYPREESGPSYRLEGQRPQSAVSPKGPRVVQPKRPTSARPASSRHPRPKSLSLSYPAPSRKTASRSKPETPGSSAYGNVKYQQKSWDEFSDYVWDKLNEDEDQVEPQAESCEGNADDADKVNGEVRVSEDVEDCNQTEKTDKAQDEEGATEEVQAAEVKTQAEVNEEKADEAQGEEVENGEAQGEEAKDGEMPTGGVVVVEVHAEEKSEEVGVIPGALLKEAPLEIAEPQSATDPEEAKDADQSSEDSGKKKHVHFAEQAIEIHEEVVYGDDGEIADTEFGLVGDASELLAEEEEKEEESQVGESEAPGSPKTEDV